MHQRVLLLSDLDACKIVDAAWKFSNAQERLSYDRNNFVPQAGARAAWTHATRRGHSLTNNQIGAGRLSSSTEGLPNHCIVGIQYRPDTT